MEPIDSLKAKFADLAIEVIGDGIAFDLYLKRANNFKDEPVSMTEENLNQAIEEIKKRLEVRREFDRKFDELAIKMIGDGIALDLYIKWANIFKTDPTSMTEANLNQAINEIEECLKVHGEEEEKARKTIITDLKKIQRGKSEREFFHSILTVFARLPEAGRDETFYDEISKILRDLGCVEYEEWKDNCRRKGIFIIEDMDRFGEGTLSTAESFISDMLKNGKEATVMYYAERGCIKTWLEASQKKLEENSFEQEI